jgi:hypothetical protein
MVILYRDRKLSVSFVRFRATSAAPSPQARQGWWSGARSTTISPFFSSSPPNPFGIHRTATTRRVAGARYLYLGPLGSTRPAND